MSEDLALFDLPRRRGRPRRLSVAAHYMGGLQAAEHLHPSDRALIELGRRLALEVDNTDDPKTLVALSGQLLAVLDRLGLSARARTQLGLGTTVQEVSPIDDLALIRAARRDAGPGS